MVNEIVLIGRSNVGKSTLFKALTGRNVRIGRRPGVTVSPTRVKLGDIVYVDMPGYGFMERVPVSRQEKTKDFIVHYFEDHRQDILLVIQVIDASSFLDIARRWEKRGEIPLEIELFEFLTDLDTSVAVAANKIDKVSKKDETLDGIGEKLGMLPPWRQWQDRIAPISAKKGKIGPIRKIIRDMHDQKK